MANVIFNRSGLERWPLAPCHVAQFHWRPGFEARSRFSQFQLFFVESGTGHYAVDGERMELAAGMVFWNSPGCYREIWCGLDESLNVLLCGAMGTALPALVQETLRELHGARPPARGHEIQGLMRTMVAVAEAKGPHCERIVANYIAILLLTIGEAFQAEPGAVPERIHTYLACKRYMEANCRKLRSAEEAAERHGISHEYLCRLFRRFAQTTPHQFLLQNKMSYALFLMETHDLSIKQIAFQLGFAGASSFSKTFHRVMGRPPSHFLGRTRGG
ncbi:MAG: AraC family transcriptional regulator [Planctomycetota bacterium]|nr:AraC family transcriptional regulator [Planctomycetota bacterium]